MTKESSPFERTADALSKAQKWIAASAGMTRAAKSHKALMPSERKLIDRALIDLSEALEKIRIVINAINIQIRNES